MASNLFALPSRKMFPLSDRTHVILAWDMVKRAKGLSDAGRQEARENILKRAKELGIDTSNWSQINAAALHGSALAVTGENSHPNRMPFAGILTWYDVPSDNPPHGSGGQRVLIPSEIGIPALASLVGQAVNFVANSEWTKHNSQDKVGVITAASAGEPMADGAIPVYIEGYIYAQDFPEAATAIKLNQNLLGLSYETSETALAAGTYHGEDVAVTTSLGYYTGAAILLKHTAAYTSTAIAAANSNQEAHMADKKTLDIKPEHMDALKAMKAAIQHIDSIADSMMAEFGTKDPDEKGDGDKKGGVQAAGADTATETTVTPPAATVVPPAATVAAVETPPATTQVATAAAPDTATSLAALAETVKSLQTTMAAMTAASDGQRRSAAYPTQLAAGHAQTPESDHTKLLAAIDADTSLSMEQRWVKKIEVRDAALKAQRQ